jgi:hypothetical protein
LEESQSEKSNTNDDEIVTTPEEIEAYHIVRGLLSKHVTPNRIVIRDTKSYCGILLDDNNRKPLCRLRFNASQKFLSLMDSEKNEEKHPIDEPIDIFKFEKRLVEALGYYNSTNAES